MDGETDRQKDRVMERQMNKRTDEPMGGCMCGPINDGHKYEPMERGTGGPTDGKALSYEKPFETLRSQAIYYRQFSPIKPAELLLVIN